jgi:hypothetical protein
MNVNSEIESLYVLVAKLNYTIAAHYSAIDLAETDTPCIIALGVEQARESVTALAALTAEILHRAESPLAYEFFIYQLGDHLAKYRQAAQETEQTEEAEE